MTMERTGEPTPIRSGDSAPESGGLKGTLTRKVGPLPVYGWGIAVVGAIIVVVIVKSRSSAPSGNAVSGTGDTSGSSGDSSLGASGSTGGTSSAAPGTGALPIPNPTVPTNPVAGPGGTGLLGTLDEHQLHLWNTGDKAGLYKTLDTHQQHLFNTGQIGSVAAGESGLEVAMTFPAWFLRLVPTGGFMRHEPAVTDAQNASGMDGNTQSHHPIRAAVNDPSMTERFLMPTGEATDTRGPSLHATYAQDTPVPVNV